MSFRPHGRAQVDATRPRAFGVCDRCGFLYNLKDLKWQFDYAGIGLLNYRILVCSPCYDKPQDQKRPVILPPDPLPVANARIEPYELDETNWRVTQDGSFRTDQAGDTRVTEPSQWQSFIVTASSGTGTVATLTFNNSYVITLGTEITITGMVPNIYNGSYAVTASSAGSVSYASVATGSLTTPGTIIVPGLSGTY